MPVKPVINFSKCEGCPDCVNKCQNNVLSLREITAQEIESLGFFGKQKAKKHPQKAYVKNPEKCTCCVSCEMVCKKGAIHLTELK